MKEVAMDAYAFDRITRSLGATRSRRKAMLLLAGSAFLPFVGMGERNAQGKKKKNRCQPNWESCAIGGAKACCSGADKC